MDAEQQRVLALNDAADALAEEISADDAVDAAKDLVNQIDQFTVELENGLKMAEKEHKRQNKIYKATAPGPLKDAAEEQRDATVGQIRAIKRELRKAAAAGPTALMKVAEAEQARSDADASARAAQAEADAVASATERDARKAEAARATAMVTPSVRAPPGYTSKWRAYEGEKKRLASFYAANAAKAVTPLLDRVRMEAVDLQGESINAVRQLSKLIVPAQPRSAKGQFVKRDPFITEKLKNYGLDAPLSYTASNVIASIPVP